MEDDIIDKMPSMVGANMILDEEISGPAVRLERNVTDGRDTAGARKRANKKKRRGGGGAGSATEEKSAEAAAAARSSGTENLTMPKQKPGESAKAYARRVD